MMFFLIIFLLSTYQLRNLPGPLHSRSSMEHCAEAMSNSDAANAQGKARGLIFVRGGHVSNFVGEVGWMGFHANAFLIFLSFGSQTCFLHIELIPVDTRKHMDGFLSMKS